MADNVLCGIQHNVYWLYVRLVLNLGDIQTRSQQETPKSSSPFTMKRESPSERQTGRTRGTVPCRTGPSSSTTSTVTWYLSAETGRTKRRVPTPAQNATTVTFMLTAHAIRWSSRSGVYSNKCQTTQEVKNDEDNKKILFIISSNMNQTRMHILLFVVVVLLLLLLLKSCIYQSSEQNTQSFDGKNSEKGETTYLRMLSGSYENVCGGSPRALKSRSTPLRWHLSEILYSEE